MLMEHRWIAKALVQKAVSKTGASGAYHFAQRMIGGLRNFHPNQRIGYAGLIAADIGPDKLDGATVVEVGTGWAPIIPIGLHLLGARRIISFDLTMHLLPEMTLQAIPAMRECLPDLALRSGLPLPTLEERLANLLSCDLQTVYKRIGFEYRAPSDFTRSDIAPGSIDLLYSNLVFEHVTPTALTGILNHSRGILKPDGLAWHCVDYTDHYAHTFKDLSLINFLRYGERTWNAIGQSDIHYQNRLRKSDYVQAFVEAGFEIAREEDQMGVSEAHAREAPLAERFATRDLSDLTCTSSRFVLRIDPTPRSTVA
jgi:hypothetical protein